MAIQEVVSLVGRLIEQHIEGEVKGIFVKAHEEGLLITHKDVQYVLVVKTRDQYELWDEFHPKHPNYVYRDVGGEC